MKRVPDAWYNYAILKTSTPVLLFNGVFSEGNIRLSNIVGNVSYNGGLYLGNGWLQDINPCADNLDTEIDTTEIHINGLDASALSIVMNTTRIGCKGELYLGFLSTPSQVASAVKIWEGIFTYATVNNSPDSIDCVLYYETELLELERPKNNRYNNETQRFYYPSDTGFMYSDSLQDKTFQFGTSHKDLEDAEKKREKKKRRENTKKKKGRS